MLSFLFNGTSTSQSPRSEIPLDCTKQGECALIAGDFKLLQGPVISATWSGQLSPNKSTGPMAAVFKRYTAQCSSGCLYNIKEDIGEHIDLAADPKHVATLKQMQARALSINASVFWPDRGEADWSGECGAAEKHGNFFAPWLP